MAADFRFCVFFQARSWLAGLMEVKFTDTAEFVVRIDGVTVARATHPVLLDISLIVHAGDRIRLTGENGSGKSSLLMLLASRLHPFDNRGTRRYSWEDEDFRKARAHIGLISRDEQSRLLRVHRQSTVREFLTGHLDGQDFLYREALESDSDYVQAALETWSIMYLARRYLHTLSLGEMRLAMLARLSLLPRKIYLMDEPFSSLSAENRSRLLGWLQRLPADAAVMITGHDPVVFDKMTFNRQLQTADGKLESLISLQGTQPTNIQNKSAHATHGLAVAQPGEIILQCRNADFFHNFNPIFADLSFMIKAGDRILVTGHNGSGKTTLLRIIHGDFYPAYGAGTLNFTGTLSHEHKQDLWARVQFVSAAHFDYFPTDMHVRHVLTSRISGSIYEYPEEIEPPSMLNLVAEFELQSLVSRRFATLSEGEKTRVLFARALALPAPVYLVDEGFISLSRKFFTLAAKHLNRVPDDCVIVIAANERINDLQQALAFNLAEWHMERGKLTTAPAASL
jgi:molybdate transport system ATP-binding protein